MKHMKQMVSALLAVILVAGVCVMPTEARSDNAKVKVIQETIDNAEDGATVDLTEDLMWGDGEPIEIPKGKNVILDLNGHDLVSLENFPVIRVKAGEQLTIVDQGEVPDGKIENATLPDGLEIRYYAE